MNSNTEISCIFEEVNKINKSKNPNINPIEYCLQRSFWPVNWYELNNIWVSVGNDQLGNDKPPDSVVYRYISDYMIKIWGVEIKNVNNYIRAFTHKSYKNDNLQNNERLEFLGDSVLQIIITEYLFDKYPSKSEGFLTKVRMKLINGKNLAELGFKLKLEKFIRVSPRLKMVNNKLIEDAFEALTCVIYHENGLNKTKHVILKIFEANIDFDEILIDNNYKEILLKYSQKLRDANNNHLKLEYYMIDEVGPAHNKIFRVQVKLSGRQLGIGSGNTRKNSEQNAARESLLILDQNFSQICN